MGRSDAAIESSSAASNFLETILEWIGMLGNLRSVVADVRNETNEWIGVTAESSGATLQILCTSVQVHASDV
jgi:hypothetical protein